MDESIEEVNSVSTNLMNGVWQIDIWYTDHCCRTKECLVTKKSADVDLSSFVVIVTNDLKHAKVVLEVKEEVAPGQIYGIPSNLKVSVNASEESEACFKANFKCW